MQIPDLVVFSLVTAKQAGRPFPLRSSKIFPFRPLRVRTFPFPDTEKRYGLFWEKAELGIVQGEVLSHAPALDQDHYRRSDGIQAQFFGMDYVKMSFDIRLQIDISGGFSRQQALL